MKEINKYGQYKTLNGKLNIFDVIVRFFSKDDIDTYYVNEQGEFILEDDRIKNEL